MEEKRSKKHVLRNTWKKHDGRNAEKKYGGRNKREEARREQHDVSNTCAETRANVHMRRNAG